PSSLTAHWFQIIIYNFDIFDPSTQLDIYLSHTTSFLSSISSSTCMAPRRRSSRAKPSRGEKDCSDIF
ncbi:hypothetical protein LINPERHAP1_LOCUS40974, partial [Linum perenne]